MPSSVSYILVALTLTSAMIAAVFFIAWKTLGEKPHALSWSFAFMAATAQWFFTLAYSWFPDFQTYWIMVNTFALAFAVFCLRGHCQRTECTQLPNKLWPFAVVIFLAVVWFTVLQPHVGLRSAIVPAVVAVTLFLSAAMIVRYRDKPRPGELAAAITIGLFGLTQLVASGVGLAQGAVGDPYVREMFVAVSFLTMPAGYMGMALFIIFMLASDLSEQMKDIAIRDQLTDLLNRRGFNEEARRAYASARRFEKPVSVIMTDIDRFKAINDAFGHSAGDMALVHFADLLKLGRRADDVVARVGGEEFAVILPGTGLADALSIADALCARVSRSPLTVESRPLSMTASFGVATISDNDTCLTDIIVRADRALYRSKRAGRNRVDLESSQVLQRMPDGTLRRASA